MVEGHTLLKKHIDETRKIDRVKAAAEMGVSPASLHYWVNGGQRPRAFERDLIETWSDGAVPASAWVTEEERERLAAVAGAGAGR